MNIKMKKILDLYDVNGNLGSVITRTVAKQLIEEGKGHLKSESTFMLDVPKDEINWRDFGPKGNKKILEK